MSAVSPASVWASAPSSGASVAATKAAATSSTWTKPTRPEKRIVAGRSSKAARMAMLGPAAIPLDFAGPVDDVGAEADAREAAVGEVGAGAAFDGVLEGAVVGRGPRVLRVGGAEDPGSADVGEAGEALGDRSLERVEAADQVDRRAGDRIAGAVDRHHAGEVDGAVAAGDGGAHRRGVADVAGDAFDGGGQAGSDEVEVDRVRLEIENADGVAARDQIADYPGPDEPGAAGDEDAAHAAARRLAWRAAM
jgi:hypothetical protein